MDVHRFNGQRQLNWRQLGSQPDRKCAMNYKYSVAHIHFAVGSYVMGDEPVDDITIQVRPADAPPRGAVALLHVAVNIP